MFNSAQSAGWSRVAVILLVAVLIRGGVAWWRIDALASDPDAYGAIAVSLHEAGVYGLIAPDGDAIPTAYRPPLYPLLLSLTVHDGQWSLAAVAILHVLMGAATVCLTYLAGVRLIGSAGIVAAGLVAVDPILLLQSTQVMTETLATLLAAAVIWWWSRFAQQPRLIQQTRSLRFSLGLGVLLASAFLCRPTFLVWGLLLVVAILGLGQLPLRHRIAQAAIVAALLFGTVAIWTARNVAVIGSPIWATSHGGYTLLLGNNPLFYDYLRQRNWLRAWDAEPFLNAYLHRYQGDPRKAGFWQRDWSGVPARFPHELTETEDDRLAYEAAMATIRREPGTFVWSSMVRISRLWSPLPHQGPGRSWQVVAAVGLYYGIVYALVIVAIWRLGWRLAASPWWPIWSLVITLSAVHAVYWSNLRMRAPAIPGIAIVAAGSLVRRTDAN